MSGATLPVRLARREVRRRPGRTLLVALLVALPVAGMAGAAVLVRTDRVTPAQRWQGSYGQAEAVSFRPSDDPGAAADGGPAPVELPDGARRVTVVTAYPRVRTADHRHRRDLEVRDLPLGDPLTVGIVDLVAGRAPAAADEIALAPPVAHDLGVDVGGTLVLDRPDLRLSVVGLVEQAGCLSCSTALVAPGTLPASLGGPSLGRIDLIDLPDLPAPELARLASDEGLQLRSETIGAPSDDGPEEGVRWSLVIGAVALTVMGIVISAAFAVGARRQLVTLGQLAASGAAPATLRTTLVLQGTFTGLIGVAAGLVVAAASLAAFRHRIEVVLGHRFDHFVVRPLDQVAVVLIGVAAATIAALIPARTAATLPTLAALAGRRPLSPVPRRLVAAGVAAMAVGLALLGVAVVGSNGGRSGNVWALVAIVGGVAELLGACAIAPALVSRLEPLAGRLHGSWRLAARGLARSRTRTGAVVSAVAAAGALAIVATALVRGADERDRQYRYLRVGPEVVAARQLTDVPIPAAPDDGRRTMASIPGAGEGTYRTTASVPSAALRGEIGKILPAARSTVVRSASAPGTRDADGNPVDGLTVRLPMGDEGAGRASYANMSDGVAIVADPAVLDAAGLSAGGRRALERDGLVLLSVEAGPAAQLDLPDGGTRRVARVEAQHAVSQGSDLLVTAAAAADLHLTVTPTALLFRNPTPLTSSQRDLIEDLQLEPSNRSGTEGEPYTDIAWSTPDTTRSPFPLELLLTGLALVFSLFVVGASLALAAAESRDERDVLTVAGAPPATLARAAGARAWLLSGLGGAMAVPIGFLPAVVYSRTAADDFPLVFPGRTVALLLLAVPTVVALAASASSAAAQRLRPVRVATATFE